MGIAMSFMSKEEMLSFVMGTLYSKLIEEMLIFVMGTLYSKFIDLDIFNTMGIAMSFMSKGLPTKQMLSFVMGTLYSKFVDKDINTFDEFHLAILDIFNTINVALLGKHYEAPPQKDVEVYYEEWKKAEPPERKKLFIDFMKKKVNLSKMDDSTLFTGLITPPAAMAAKRAVESLPQLSLIKSIPGCCLCSHCHRARSHLCKTFQEHVPWKYGIIRFHNL